jgi:hypothetical protein
MTNQDEEQPTYPYVDETDRSTVETVYMPFYDRVLHSLGFFSDETIQRMLQDEYEWAMNHVLWYIHESPASNVVDLLSKEIMSDWSEEEKNDATMCLLLVLDNHFYLMHDAPDIDGRWRCVGKLLKCSLNIEN